MTGTDRTDEWERIARQTLWQSLTRLGEDTSRTAEEVADTLYWGNDLAPEQVERMRQAAFDLRYATEEYLTRLCDETEPWGDDCDERTPSWHPTEGPTPDDAPAPDDREDGGPSGDAPPNGAPSDDTPPSDDDPDAD